MQVRERTVYLWDKKKEEGRRCDDSDGETVSMNEELPSTGGMSMFEWLHEWELDRNPTLFDWSDPKWRQYGPLNCFKKKKGLRQDVQWSSDESEYREVHCAL